MKKLLMTLFIINLAGVSMYAAQGGQGNLYPQNSQPQAAPQVQKGELTPELKLEADAFKVQLNEVKGKIAEKQKEIAQLNAKAAVKQDVAKEQEEATEALKGLQEQQAALVEKLTPFKELGYDLLTEYQINWSGMGNILTALTLLLIPQAETLLGKMVEFVKVKKDKSLTPEQQLAYLGLTAQQELNGGFGFKDLEFEQQQKLLADHGADLKAKKHGFAIDAELDRLADLEFNPKHKPELFRQAGFESATGINFTELGLDKNQSITDLWRDATSDLFTAAK